MNNDIQLSIDTFRDAAARYERPERYYNGEHDLRFATEKFENAFGTLFREFALNLCPIVCDAIKDKLRINGFSVDSYGVEAGNSNSQNPANSVNSVTRRIWLRNRMPLRAGELHKGALTAGDAYAIVWPDDNGQACIYPNRAGQVTVTYDDERPGRIVRAAKWWLTADKYVRMNLFYPDRIEKYVSKEKSEGTLPEADAFVPGPHASRVHPTLNYSARGQAGTPAVPASGAHIIPNPFGIVPVFHFANNASIGSFGRSELDAAIPIQDGLNKSVLDMLVAMEYSAFRQRWATGIEVEYDAEGNAKEPFQIGVDRLWIGAKEAKFGDFEAAELEQFLKVKDSFRIDIASVSGTPLHYFLQQAHEAASGESLKRSETRFLSKVRDRQLSFGQVWADVMAFALRVEGLSDVELITEWEDPSPMSERERLENILLKRQIGLPVEEALIEAGYGAVDADGMVGKSGQQSAVSRQSETSVSTQ